MRNKFLVLPLLITALATILFLRVSSIDAAQEVLTLVSPSNCPSSGCAAGQRLNFNLSFAVSPDETVDPNTQVCIYALQDGVEGTGSASWADRTNTSITLGTDYTNGEVDSVCTSHIDGGDELLASAYAKLPGSTSDTLDFVLHINPTTDIDGYIKVKIFQLETGGMWTEAASGTEPIPVAATADTAYIGQYPVDCENFSPCYVNSGDDINSGLGTGLRDAVMALDPNSSINILNNYVIKGNTVKIDKALTIRGYQNATLTYTGTNCNNPMLSFTNGGTLQDIAINDGNNCVSPSRNLVEIESPNDVAILHNSLTSGHNAVNVKESTGNVKIAFNQLTNNTNYAVNNTSTGPGEVKIYANNIFNNRTGAQVNCNSHGQADHNYWGEDMSASSSVIACEVDDEKRLGAPILLSSGSAGVEAIERTVKGTAKYYFNSKIGVRHTEDTDFDAVIVNHGQGSESNIPFLSDSGVIEACSNFYDVFLAEGNTATNLFLSLKYDLNSQCITTIESGDYCGQADSTQYPLWWYDPANNLTDGWDKTGQNPQGTGADGATGQTTTCNINNKTITVTIDGSGRPGIVNDLAFTPFVVGLPVFEGVTLSQFTANLDVTEVDLRWVTTSENNVKSFYVLRSDTETGTYTRISSQIEAIGDLHIGGIYNYTDDDIVYKRTYYYKIEVINKQNETIATLGPVSVLTSTATPTLTLTPTITLTPTPTQTRTPTLTRTPYPTRTPQPYYYRSPTSLYQAGTSTPGDYPTQVRTYGPTPTGTRTFTANTTLNPTTTSADTSDFDNGYPVEENPTIDYPTAGYPAPGEEAYPSSTPTPVRPVEIDLGDTGTEPSPTKSTGSNQDEGQQADNPGEVRWFFLLIGAASGLSLLGAASVLIAKSRLS